MTHTAPRGHGNELISVVIPCYNQGQYLAEAIQSIFAQTHTKVEVLVVDDGSTDNTSDVAQSYPQVTYIYQRNQGSSVARNAGWRASTGDYVAFLDADDRFLQNAMEAGLSCFRKFPDSGFVFGRYRNIDQAGEVISGPNAPPDESDFYNALLQKNLIGMQSTVLHSKSVLETVGGFEPRFLFAEDYELFLRIASRFPVRKHDEVVAEYRRHGQSKSQNYRDSLDTTLAVLESQGPNVKRNPRYQEAIKRGFTNWKNYFGQLMIQEFRTHIKVHGFDRGSIFRFKNVISCYPKGIRSITKSALLAAFR